MLLCVRRYPNRKGTYLTLIDGNQELVVARFVSNATARLFQDEVYGSGRCLEITNMKPMEELMKEYFK